jgi:phenylalanyl-tRNA synthetase beta chain
LLGLDLAEKDMVQALAALGFQPKVAGDLVTCTVPPQRMDIEREVDLIEEVIRLLGTDRLPVADAIRIRTASPDNRVIAIERAKDLLAGMGFVECVTHALVTERTAEAFLGPGQHALRVDDERAGGTPCLRPAVLTGPLTSRKLNADRGVSAGLRLFEVAHAFRLGADGDHQEWPGLALVADAEDASQGYRTLRGVVERLVHELSGATVQVQPGATLPGMQPAAEVRVDGQPLGHVGLLAKEAADRLGLEGMLAVAELRLEPLVSRFPPERPAAALPAFPGIDRDLSIAVAEATTWEQVTQVVHEARPEHLESLAFVGTYRGKQVGAGRKSLTMRLVFRKPDGTLRREEVEPTVASLTALLQKRLAAELRS